MKKRLFSLLTASFLCVSVFAGCTPASKTDEKVVIEVGSWPAASNPAEQARYEEVAARLEKDFPNIEVNKREFNYNVRSYLPQAASGQLPTIYMAPITEIDKIVDAGFAADVTEFADKYGFTEAYSDQIKELITRDGKQYVVAQDVYTMGLAINKTLFKKAGLEDENGLKIPQTYDEVREFSEIIKEKTGAYGFGMITKNGWHMLNLAWSYGTTFEEKVGDKWQAKFGSKEFVNALTWLRDMKDDGFFPQNALVTPDDLYRMFATDQLAMMFYVPSTNGLVENYAMDKDNVAYASLPAGPAGRYAQMGGVLYFIDSNATPEQIDACFKWIEYIGDGPKLTEQTKETIEARYKGTSEKGFITGIRPFSVWNEETDVRKYTIGIIDKYANVDVSYFTDYMDYDKVTVKAEEPVNCQELYTVIGGCIQEALSNPDTDLLKMAKEAADNFQRNSLENVE